MNDRFPTESEFQGHLTQYIFFSYKFHSATNESKKSSPNNCKNKYVAENPK